MYYLNYSHEIALHFPFPWVVPNSGRVGPDLVMRQSLMKKQQKKI